MAKQITHVSLFLASPSDLSEERQSVQQVVDELNTLMRTTMSIHLDLLTWETDAYPSAGIDAQDVINNQIGSDYDIFIGMMWQRFGTPTGRAGSGTEEEFERAYSRFVETKGKTKIMLYFSSKPIPPDDINFDELSKVRSFKLRAQELGILHWAFNDNDSFQKMLKIHLANQIKDVVESLHTNINPNKYNNDSNIESHSPEDIDNTEDENGYFDLLEIFLDNFSQIETTLTKMGEHIEDLGQQISRKANKLDTLNKSPNKSPNSYRILFESTSSDIINYVNLTSIELPRFHDLFTNGIDAFSDALTIHESSGNKMEPQELEELIESIIGTKVNIYFASNSMVGFRDNVSQIPSAAKSLNRATRLLKNTLNNVITEFNNSTILLDELEKTVHSMLIRTQDGDSEATLI
ncbi:DUF4062 domain-containing protein [Hymenobacter oligotrophus]|uniref:DUF4062 domain-containing protein n=1 Tax=Hymenobacter oligotrophus TaxID=2319843 RepID=A0A3B7QW91_9BACT|nr:DUF4062 domain-containing protein [Hymenobacter oligotrophus]AYA37368.1 DUF4062 domain-containing protein [Hymenobacter oligotrophus]